MVLKSVLREDLSIIACGVGSLEMTELWEAQSRQVF